MDKRFYQNNGATAAVFYAVCSTSMAFLNKAVINTFEFNFPFFIMTCQMAVTLLFLEIFKNQRIISIPQCNLKSARLFLYPSLGYAAHAILSLMALEGLNIPMYTAVKRCTPIVNLIFSVVLLKKPFPSYFIIMSILLITLGCFLAAFGDLTFDAFAYTFGGLSVLAQGLYLTLVQKFSENNMSTFEILYYNSFNTLGPFVIFCIISWEPAEIAKNTYLKDLTFQLTFWTLICLGAVLNYSLFLCTTLNSALTTSLVSCGKSAIQTIIGIFAFGGIEFHPLNATGLFLNLFGGLIYTLLKYKDVIQGNRVEASKKHLPVVVDASENNNVKFFHSNVL